MTTTESTSGDTRPQTPSRELRRRAGVAGFTGSMIEYYDFLVYAFLTVTMAPQFFPTQNPATSTLAALAVYGTGFVARPLGGVFFGWLGDRRGRRDALLLTVLIMGLATALMGLVPVYAAAGLLAPALLVVTRIVQGFAAGGELIGSATYLWEVSEGRKRGHLISIGTLGSGVGAVLAPITVGTTTLVVGTEAMSAWGWRIPFLLAIPLLLLSLRLRLRLEDSAEFRQLAAESRLERFPLRRVVQEHKVPLLQVFALNTAASVPAVLVVVYMNVYLTQVLHIAQQNVFWLSAVVLLLALPAFSLGGRAVDRFGSRRSVGTMFIACSLIIYPAILLMGLVHNIAVVGLLYLAAAACNYALQAAVYPSFVSLFPPAVRYSGSALGWNLGAVLGAGISPVVAGLLVTATGMDSAPAFLMFVATAIALITLATIKRPSTGEPAESPAPAPAS
ncbi:MFS transporter [Streptomyces iranensis]|uniref:MFS transporter n=1 Tax=Streptomyces iranensis TaxID=576784 RepID=UPI0039B7358F